MSPYLSVWMGICARRARLGQGFRQGEAKRQPKMYNFPLALGVQGG